MRKLKQPSPTVPVEKDDEVADKPWEKLFELAGQFKRLQPWQWMGDVDMFAVVDPESEETGYCCVLGEADETYGLAVYVGDDGFRSMIEIFQGDRDVDPIEQRALLLSFENRADLATEDYRLIKNLGLSYRGRHAWPVFRSFVPGYMPWVLEEWEIRFLSTVLEQVLQVCQRVKDEPRLIKPQGDRLFARVARRTNSGYVWSDGSVLDSVEAEERYASLYISGSELEELRNAYPLQQRAWECDITYFSEAVQDEPGERPYFPYLYLCVDADSRLIIDYELVDPEQAVVRVQQKFIQLIQRMGGIPAAVHIDNEDTYMILVPLAAELGIELFEAELSGIHEVREGMFESMR